MTRSFTWRGFWLGWACGAATMLALDTPPLVPRAVFALLGALVLALAWGTARGEAI